jgi:hypothetical protein
LSLFLFIVSDVTENFMRAPIALPDVAAEQFRIKTHLVTMVQQNQFGGSTSEDAGMHLHTLI